ncbi:hypothetical protein SAMN05443550_11360 [Pedobacter hartonius]|uniref:Uncharacterized protein n=1 Tax=Pedobacter hartonius TaxID=425514 RepID=A0A1H4H625_9SPHI|nr:hypothetical protein SAMN05443550_11360 [Pedobacter hartonius]
MKPFSIRKTAKKKQPGIQAAFHYSKLVGYKPKLYASLNPTNLDLKLKLVLPGPS